MRPEVWLWETNPTAREQLRRELYIRELQEARFARQCRLARKRWMKRHVTPWIVGLFFVLLIVGALWGPGL